MELWIWMMQKGHEKSGNKSAWSELIVGANINPMLFLQETYY